MLDLLALAAGIILFRSRIMRIIGYAGVVVWVFMGFLFSISGLWLLSHRSFTQCKQNMALGRNKILLITVLVCTLWSLHASFTSPAAGHSTSMSLQLFLASYLGPLSGFLYPRFSIQALLCFAICALLISLPFWRRSAFWVCFSIIGIILWFLNSVGPISTGIWFFRPPRLFWG